MLSRMFHPGCVQWLQKKILNQISEFSVKWKSHNDFFSFFCFCFWILASTPASNLTDYFVSDTRQERIYHGMKTMFTNTQSGICNSHVQIAFHFSGTWTPSLQIITKAKTTDLSFLFCRWQKDDAAVHSIFSPANKIWWWAWIQSKGSFFKSVPFTVQRTQGKCHKRCWSWEQYM